jgi:single-strand DNA-binding protein
MNDLNSVLLEGNLVRDPELRAAQNGISVCNFSIAYNRSYKKGDIYEKETSFFDVNSWGKLAEMAAGVGKKGRKARIVGRLKQERWQSAEGKAMSRITVVAEHIEFRPEHKYSGGENQEDEIDL